MPLTRGARLGAYEIVSALGAGGMGEVYKARDTRLDRTVAIKILPEALAADPQLRNRFALEARAVSQLTHPNICTLYDVGSEQDSAFLVMEYLDGETLERRLERGALPVAEALKLAIQIADALSTAHRHGIVHRDLKPGNVMLTKAGAKLLDFGLAKTGAPTGAGSFSMLPTTPPALTQPGTILGTFQYMAPEQLEGKEADARTDIFSFGAVLYEMVAGRKAFAGTSQASLIAAIIHSEPSRLSTVRPVAPASLEHLVRRCLEKDPDARWQSASDILAELRWIVEAGASASEARTDARGDVPVWRRPVPVVYVVALAALAALGGAAASRMARPAAPQTRGPISRLTVALPPGDRVLDVEFPSLALSPDGSALAYAAVSGGKQQLFLRRLGTAQSEAIDSTDGARGPFFSPDGEWIGFFAQNKLKKVSVATGTVQTVCDAPSGRGGAWGPDDAIYFSPSGISGLWKVSASGGTPTEVTHLDRGKGEVSHRWPQVLPGGTLLFTVWTGPGLDEKLIESQVLATGERRVLVQGADTGRYVTTGHLVYARADQLLSMAMDVRRLAVSGTPVPLEEHARIGSEGAQYAVSDNGEVAYLPGSPARYEHRIVWVDRKGAIEPLPLPIRDYANVALSPDGRQAAIQIVGSYITLWIYDFLRSTLTPLTTSTASSQSPVWTPDGTRVVYRGTRAGLRNLFWKAVDGTREEERLTTKEGVNQAPGTLSPDGKWMAFDEVGAHGGDLWMLPLSGDRKPQAFLTTPANEQTPRFSPDGRWVAYVSDEGGRYDVYVQEFSGPGAKRRVSIDGGTEPIWARNGRELFYLNGDRLMAVDIETKPPLSLGAPRLVVEGAYVRSETNASAYDVSPDGQRFLRVQPTEPEPPTNQIGIVLNWSEELREHAPAR